MGIVTITVNYFFPLLAYVGFFWTKKKYHNSILHLPIFHTLIAGHDTGDAVYMQKEVCLIYVLL